MRPDIELMMRLTRLFGQLGCSSDRVVAKLCIIAMRFVALTKKKLNPQAKYKQTEILRPTDAICNYFLHNRSDE